MSDDGSEATGARGYDPRNQSGPNVTWNWSLRSQFLWSRHQISPPMLASKAMILAVISCSKKALSSVDCTSTSFLFKIPGNVLVREWYRYIERICNTYFQSKGPIHHHIRLERWTAHVKPRPLVCLWQPAHFIQTSWDVLFKYVHGCMSLWGKG